MDWRVDSRMLLSLENYAATRRDTSYFAKTVRTVKKNGSFEVGEDGTNEGAVNLNMKLHVLRTILKIDCQTSVSKVLRPRAKAESHLKLGPRITSLMI